MLRYLLFVGSFAFVFGAHLPSTLPICHRSDKNFEECLKTSTEAALLMFASGNKELSLNPLEPLRISKMSAEGLGSVQVEQVYTNIDLHGLTKLKVLKFTIDFDKCKMEIESFSPNINIFADYHLKGHMSVFTVNGHGRTNQSLNNLKLKHHITCEHFEKDGEKYLRITDYTTDFVEYDIHFHFDNLVPNNEQLSNEIDNVLRENSNAIFDETKPAYEKTYAELFKQLGNGIFTKVPFDEIFPQ